MIEMQENKRLTEGAGQMILKNLGLSLADLNAEEAIAPFYYETNPHGECVLVVENKDTCFSSSSAAPLITAAFPAKETTAFWIKPCFRAPNAKITLLVIFLLL